MIRHRTSPAPEAEIACAALNCRNRDLVEGAPVPVCAHHLRRLYEFARDMVEASAGPQE